MNAGTLSLLLGLVAVILVFVPGLGLLSWPLGLVGLVIAGTGLRRRRVTDPLVLVTALALSSGAIVCAALYLLAYRWAPDVTSSPWVP